MVWSNVEIAIIIAKPQGGYMMSGAATGRAAGQIGAGSRGSQATDFYTRIGSLARHRILRGQWVPRK